ncbi:MAG TPA: DNA methyltransferase, partial [Isosphaeraceae bacterium]|nr:DNA methyltransferase [Isosphaeraceae bacterium]
AEGRYLAVSLDTAIDRADQPELETIAALFSADVLQPPAEGGTEQLAHWVDESRKHAVGVSAELREGLRESVQIIANEVLDRIRSHGLAPGDVAELGDLARELGRDALRYLYRILFLLYAEARPELGILPADDQDYVAGYSMQRLGELVARRLIGEEARTGFHLYESLDLLFRMVNDGHRARGNASTEGLSEGEGLRFESLKADLFEPSKTRLIGRIPDPRYDEGPVAPLLDTRLRDEALYKVLRRLMLAKGNGRKGKNQRGGFISYAQLGINQLGAVYEGLMSYSGFIATEELYEVAKKGDPSGGSWMILASKVPGYTDDVFVMEKDENGFPTGERVRYRPGSFVYRLAGRDRQTSASYYTPQSLTSVTVQLALEQRIKEEGRPVSAAEVLRWRVCEPALGSGAFLNEAIDQLAALYLRLREEETGDRLEPDERALALQKIKAHIALHNCYGVDLNETAVELAEVSIWLNVMHRGLQAPWFGLHLVRGNSLIGASRRLYPPEKLFKAEWLKSAPEDVPFSAGPIPSGHIHHFLLPAEGWGAVAGEKEAKELALEDTKRLADWRKAIRKPPSPKKSLGHKLSQVQRVQDLAGRAEYLWSLVIERLRISEREISRTIDVWGAEDLPVAQEAKPRDEILADLTSPGTPFWRLKTVMDAWCALWFWRVDKVSMLDGSDPIYATEPVPEPTIVELAPKAEPFFPATYVKASLFDDEPEQLTLAAATPRKPSAAKKPRIVRPVVPLRDFEDWLEFAESVLGRQDIPEDSLIADFKRLSELADYEDQLEIYMGMDPFYRLAERFPWLDTVADIAAQQGFFHWELRFAQVFSDGGFDLQLGNPPWVRPIWDENAVLAEFEPWFELVEKSSVEEQRRRKEEILCSAAAHAIYNSELTDQTAWETFFGQASTYDLLVGTQPDLYRAFMIRTWRNIGLHGTVGLLHPDTHFGGNREKILRGEAYLRLRIHGDFVNSVQQFFPPPVGHATHFGIHVYGHPKEIGFAHLSWLTDAEELPKSLTLAERGELPDGWGSKSGTPGVRYMGEWDSRPHPARVIRVDRETLSIWQRLTGDDDVPVDQARLLSPVSTEEQDAIRALAHYSVRLGQFYPQISSG